MAAIGSANGSPNEDEGDDGAANTLGAHRKAGACDVDGPLTEQVWQQAPFGHANECLNLHDAAAWELLNPAVACHRARNAAAGQQQQEQRCYAHATELHLECTP